jgi:hypothetical protein
MDGPLLGIWEDTCKIRRIQYGLEMHVFWGMEKLV